MSNDYYNRYNKDTEKKDTVKKQQTFPGFPFQPIGQPGMGGQPGRGSQPPMGQPGRGGQPPMGQPGRGGQPPMGQPGMGGQPLSAPPNFTPELPRMEGQPTGFGPQYGRPGERGRGEPQDFFRRPMDFRRCMNQFTYVWLINGSNFWFYPVNIRRPFVEGFRWRRNRWEFERINTNRILFFRCF